MIAGDVFRAPRSRRCVLNGLSVFLPEVRALPNYDTNALQACMDLGSNSFHLLIGRWTQGRIEVVERCSERVQLGEGVRASGAISPAAFERGIECLKRFDSLLQQHPIERYWALGTNTLRVASNADLFIAAAEEVGIHVSPISGVQEAVLIYAGVLTALPATSARRLVIDIGGGSTEVIVGHGSERHLTESLLIGSITWRDTYFGDPEANAHALELAMASALHDAEALFARVAPAVRAAGWDSAYAASGTIKMLASICEAAGYGEGIVTQRALQELRPAFLRHALEGAEIEGLKERRRDLLLAGWSVLLGLMRAYGIEEIRFSPTALREGMLDFMVRNERTLAVMPADGMPGLRERA